MNKTPQRPTVGQAPVPPQRRGTAIPPRRRRSGAYIAICVVLAAALVISASLNVALLISRENESLPISHTSNIPTETSGLKTEPDTTAAPATSGTAAPPETDPDESAVEALREMVESYAAAANGEFAEQVGVYDTILSLVKLDGRPTRTHYVQLTETDTDDTSADTESDEPKPLEIAAPAKVAFAYMDLETGYTFSFNADEVMYSASTVKAPYIYAVLKAVEEFEYRKMNYAADGSVLYDGSGAPLFDGEHPNLDADGRIIYSDGEKKYDLSRKWVYDSKTMFEEGSGNIQNEEDGFTLTYLQLAEYALKYSDNVAFKALINEFGYGIYNDLAGALDIKGSAYGFMQLTAGDCVKYMKEIYEYLKTGSPYAEMMKKAMTEAPYNVMLPAAVSPLTCVHKYGWDVDAYHDVGIVYHERPFAVAVMTDLDEGRYTDYVYVQSIAKAVLALHESFVPASSADTENGGV